jgi:hypothetical protein
VDETWGSLRSSLMPAPQPMLSTRNAVANRSEFWSSATGTLVRISRTHPYSRDLRDPAQACPAPPRHRAAHSAHGAGCPISAAYFEPDAHEDAALTQTDERRLTEQMEDARHPSSYGHTAWG